MPMLHTPIGITRIIGPASPPGVHRQGQATHPADIDRAAETRGIGAILRREGLYSSTLSEWRRQRDAGAFRALVPGKRGPKTAEPNPLSAEVAALQRNNARLTQHLARAEAVIDIQKKVAALLGIPLASTDGVP